MWRSWLIVTALLIAVGVVPLPAETGEGSPLAAFETGVALLERGQLRDAIEKLEAAVASDEHLIEAHAVLAQAYTALGTVHGRTKAAKVLDRALRLEPQNPRLQMAMGRLLLKRGMPGAAEDRFRKVITLDPQNAEAYYQLGLLKEKDMLWYKDLVSPHEGAVFTFEKYARQDLREAERFFLRAIDADPSFFPAYHRLAFLYHEGGDVLGMARILERAIDAGLQNADLHLFLGLAYHRLGEHAVAHKTFELAKRQMSPDAWQALESVVPVLNDHLRETYSALPDSAKRGFTRGFWQSRDPLFLTEYNERLLEHYSRLAYVNLRYGDPEEDLPGWQTDRGQVYLRFGPPQGMYRTRPHVELTFRGNPLVPAEEVWQYDEFRMVFEDPYLSRKFTFKRDLDPERDFKLLFETKIEETPELYEHDYGGSKRRLVHQMAQFKGEAGKTRVRLWVAVPTDISTRQAAKLRGTRGVFVFDDVWRRLHRGVETGSSAAQVISSADSTHAVLDEATVLLDPGKYHVCQEFVHRGTEDVAMFRKPLKVRSFAGDALMLSDVLLFQHGGDDGVPRVPNVLRTFSAGERIGLYCEIYNLKIGPDGITQYRVESALAPLPQEPGGLGKIAAGLGRLLGFDDPDRTVVATTLEYTGTAADDRLETVLHLPELEPGEYRLTVRVTDVRAGRTAEQGVVFGIIPAP